MVSGAKHSVKVLEHDPRKRYVELEVNGERVRVEKFTDEEWDELREREEKENLSIGYINLGIIPFEEEVKLKGKTYRLSRESKAIFQRMALAAYRFLWYFGPPQLKSSNHLLSLSFSEASSSCPRGLQKNNKTSSAFFALTIPSYFTS